MAKDSVQWSENWPQWKGVIIVRSPWRFTEKHDKGSKLQRGRCRKPAHNVRQKAANQDGLPNLAENDTDDKRWMAGDVTGIPRVRMSWHGSTDHKNMAGGYRRGESSSCWGWTLSWGELSVQKRYLHPFLLLITYYQRLGKLWRGLLWPMILVQGEGSYLMIAFLAGSWGGTGHHMARWREHKRAASSQTSFYSRLTLKITH